MQTCFCEPGAEWGLRARERLSQYLESAPKEASPSDLELEIYSEYWSEFDRRPLPGVCERRSRSKYMYPMQAKLVAPPPYYPHDFVSSGRTLPVRDPTLLEKVAPDVFSLMPVPATFTRQHILDEIKLRRDTKRYLIYDRGLSEASADLISTQAAIGRSAT